jgi:hypothetical protein
VQIGHCINSFLKLKHENTALQHIEFIAFFRHNRSYANVYTVYTDAAGRYA